jgi:hypothetical protein
MAYIDKLMGRGEAPVLITRRHLVVLIGYGIKWFGLSLVAFIAALWLNANWKLSSSDPAATFKLVVILALFALALVGAVAMVASYIRWYNETYIITNRRVIRVVGIFNKDEVDSSLDKLNDTKEHQSMWGRLLNYGTVEILTASDDGVDDLDYVPNPMQFRRTIQDAKNGYFNEAAAVAGNNNNGSFPPNAGIAAQPNINNNYPANGVARPPVGVGAGQPAQQYYTPQSGGGDSYQVPLAATPPTSRANGPINPQDIPGLIQQLAKLRDAGVITEEEFQVKKNDLFSRM